MCAAVTACIPDKRAIPRATPIHRPSIAESRVCGEIVVENAVRAVTLAGCAASLIGPIVTEHAIRKRSIRHPPPIARIIADKRATNS